MSIQKQAAKHIVDAYLSQELNTLDSWIGKFPDGWTWLSDHLGDLPLKNAIEKRKWLLIAYLFDCPSLPEKIGQMRIASKTLDPQLNWIVEGHFNKLPDAQFKTALFLQERVLW